MKIRISMCCLPFLLVTLSFADPAPTVQTPLADPLAEQIETLQAMTQAQIDAIVQQLEAASPAEREPLEKQIIELKRQGEVERLTLLLEAARAADDTALAAEIQKALAHWTHPPETQILPQAATDKPTSPSEPGPSSQKPSSPTTTSK